MLQFNKTGKSMPSISAKDQWISDFLNAVSFDSPVELAELLKGKHADINSMQNGTTALHTAVISKRKDNLRFLLKQKAKPKGYLYNHISPLGYAVMANSVAMSEMLIKAGADMFETDKKSAAPATKAVMKPSLKLVKMMLRNGLDPNTPIYDGYGVKGSTLLHVASIHGDLSVSQLLVEHGANVFSLGTSRTLPSETADIFKHFELSTYLRSIEKKEKDRLALESSTLPGKPVEKTKLGRTL